MLAICACGHASAPTPASRAIARGPLRGPTDAGPPDAFEPDPLLPANMQPLTYTEAAQHVATPDGPMPGVPSIAILRMPDPTRCGGEAVLTVFAPGSSAEPLLALGLAMSSPAPATLADARAWLTSVTDRARRAYAFYKQRSDSTIGLDHVEAEARLVQLERHRIDAVLHERPWRAIAQQGFCDVSARAFSTDVHDADDLAATCRSDAAALGITSGWILDACRAP